MLDLFTTIYNLLIGLQLMINSEEFCGLQFSQNCEKLPSRVSKS